METGMKSNTRTFATAMIALSLTVAGSSFAQSYGQRGDRDRFEQAQRDGRQDRRDYGARQSDRRDYRGRTNYEARRDGRGAGPNRAFYRGDRLPPEYRHRTYVVEDWRGHNLSAPPRGYHWVQTGADYVLVAIATGIILQLMLQN
jgi:Ni/Co efflux regulator RcnB